MRNTITVINTPSSAPINTSKNVCTFVSSRLSATIRAMIALNTEAIGSRELKAIAVNSAKANAVEDWQNPQVNQRNRLEMRASFHTPDPVMSLAGTWKFKGYATPAERSKDFFKVAADDSSWGTMPVPGCWELNGK